MKTIEEKAEEYCKNVICKTCSDYNVCDVEKVATTCLPHYENYDSFIAGYKAAQEWISVDDELPKNEGEYLTINENNWCSVQYFDGNSWGYLLSVKQFITHWRPIN